MRLADAAAAARSTTRVRVAIGGVVAQLPAAVVAQVAALLHELSEGRSVVVAPFDLPIGTELAASVLGVSRPWLTELLDRGEIRMQRNGTKRRVLLGDLMAYRRAKTHAVDTPARPTSRWRSSTPPADWSDGIAPTSGVVKLPFHLYWSDDNNTFDISKRSRRRSMYQIVLTEGSSDDVLTYVNPSLLLDVWEELWLSPAVHEAWDSWIHEHRHAVV